MPFKSEAQRKYLWANEPEIARDWTDTYGSGIQAAQGGRIGFFKGAQADARAGRASMSPGTSADYTPGAGHRDSGGPSITAGFFEPKVLQPGLDRAKANVDRKKAILSGAIGDPDDPSTWNFAEGGMIGSVGGISRPKYQEGNMVGAEMEGAEMEGAEMEGAMMQSQEVIKELYDALIAQGLSPQEAMEKIKEIIAASGAERPQSPMMAEEFPGQEFGGGPRAPAAFGGIMDTYTGRRKYGLGSFIKKAFKKVKKLASSKIGKLALMYAAGTYLGGMPAFGGGVGGKGMGWEKFIPRLLDPMSTEGGISNVGRTAMNLVRGKPAVTTNQYSPFLEAGYNKNLSKAVTPVAPSLIPGVSNKVLAGVAGPAIGAGLFTAAQPPEELGGEVQGEYDEDLQKWKDYYAGLGSDYSVNPDLLKSAQGGRVGRQEGGLMNLGGMEKDYRNDGGFVPLGGEEKADDVPARLSRNEFVFTADAVRNAGEGDIDRGAEVMENVMKNLEGGGKISEESQGQGAQEMFETSERLSEVI
jgi:hypothetical protein